NLVNAKTSASQDHLGGMCIKKAWIGNGPRLFAFLRVTGVSGLSFFLRATRRKPVKSSDEKRLHLVFGPPAAGKSVYARSLAKRIGACLLDSDEVTERMVRAGLALAGQD